MNTAHRPWSSANEAFLGAVAEGRLVYPGCAACGRTLGYTVRLCPCGSAARRWESASGAARVVSHATYRRAYMEPFDPPYTVVQVALAEGPRLCALWTGAGAPPSAGTAVRLHFDPHARLTAALR